MEGDRNEQIDVDFTSVEFTRAKGRRQLVYTTPNPSSIEGGGSFNFFMPTVDDNTVVIPGTIELEFRFKSKNDKSWFKNNLGRLLTNSVMVKIGGVPVYQSGSEARLNVYRDLWLTDEERKNRINFGIASEDASLGLILSQQTPILFC